MTFFILVPCVEKISSNEKLHKKRKTKQKTVKKYYLHKISIYSFIFISFNIFTLINKIPVTYNEFNRQMLILNVL